MMDFASILIPLLVILPAFAGLALLLPIRAFDDRRTAWTFTLGSTLVTFVVSLGLLFTFDFQSPQYGVQYADAVPWVEGFGLQFAWGLDAISLWLVLLSTFLMPLIVLVSGREAGDRPRQFYLWLLLVEAGMVAAFVATDVLFFFLCFEFTLIPLYFLIGLFGGQDRLAAARLFFIYTFAGSMLTFAGLLYVAWFAAEINGAWSFAFADLARAAQAMSWEQQAWVLAAFLAGFAVKVPIFPLHTWLPLTYTEAPFAGTVVLSAVLAKLGTYALIRFAIPFCPDAVADFAPAIALFAVVGIVYAALIAWVQKDAKKLIAYSSISHLGFCVLGLFALDAQNLGPVGGVLYMVNHGLATGALFLCLAILFDRFGTTIMGDLSGIGRVMPAWAFFTVFFAMASVGLPGLNGFVSEFLTLLGAFVSTEVLGPAYAMVAGLGLIFGAIYLLFMLGRIVFGPLKTPRESTRDLDGREWAALLPLAAACLFLGLYPHPVLRSLEGPVAEMTRAAHAAATAPAPIVQIEAAPDAESALTLNHLPATIEGGR